MKLLALIIATLVLCIAPAPVSARERAGRIADDPLGDATGRLLMQVAPAADPHAVLGDLESRGLRVRRWRRIRGAEVHVLEIGPEFEAIRIALATDPRVRFVEPDRKIPPARITNDPLFRRQHHLLVIGVRGAWTITTGGTTPIAILDSGVDANHPDLIGRVLPGWNAFDDNTDTSDVAGHGTEIAGVAAAIGNNGAGGCGVASSSAILPVRVTDTDGNAYYSTLTAGLVWAADHGARIANVSFALYGGAALDAAARYFVDRGGLVFASGGNDGHRHSDTANEWIVSVAATGRGRLNASFSSSGLYVDLSAPGTNILTTTRGGGYARASGTSLASPIAAGVAALVLAANPGLAPWQVEAVLEGYADDFGAPGYDPVFGWGRVNAARAVEAATWLQAQPAGTGFGATGARQ